MGSSSSTSAGYSDPRTQGYRDFAMEFMTGIPMSEQGAEQLGMNPGDVTTGVANKGGGDTAAPTSVTDPTKYWNV
jgi:hypothetical protein